MLARERHIAGKERKVHAIKTVTCNSLDESGLISNILQLPERIIVIK